jgi:hypothetical protein
LNSVLQCQISWEGEARALGGSSALSRVAHIATGAKPNLEGFDERTAASLNILKQTAPPKNDLRKRLLEAVSMHSLDHRAATKKQKLIN